jgi:hypothetical protein
VVRYFCDGKDEGFIAVKVADEFEEWARKKKWIVERPNPFLLNIRHTEASDLW